MIKLSRILPGAMFAAAVSAIFVAPAAAYVDPSIMTYAIQAIAGVVIAAGVVFGVIWRKMKNKAKKVLNIDENAKKEVEDDVVETTSNE